MVSTAFETYFFFQYFLMVYPVNKEKRSEEDGVKPETSKGYQFEVLQPK